MDEADRASWLDLLVESGWPADERGRRGGDGRAAPLAATPSRLLGVALTDVVGDRRAMNQPGTDDEYPNWRPPLADGTGRRCCSRTS